MVEAIVLAAILLFVNELLFWIESMLCKIVDLLYEMFEVFAGLKTITFNGLPDYLINVFFENKVISGIYWGMACIGITLTFIFALGAVLKKTFDSTGEKFKATYGMIFTNVFKSILLILLMTAIVSATIESTSILLRAVDNVIDKAVYDSDPDEIEFTDNQRAAMYRILSTIGNYSINPSFNNRYSINSCFNDIQQDLNYLAETRVFNYTYEGQENSWQYALRQVYVAASTDSNVYLDVYNEELTSAMLLCANRIKTNASFKPVEKYSRLEERYQSEGTLGKTIMLAGSMRAAKNGSFNKSGSITDALRAPYYFGTKDAYSYSSMKSDFSISLSSWDHAVILVAAYFSIKELAAIMFNAIARIFNIILLYITAPGFISVMPLDEGGKFKQWTTAFVIQSFSIFGSFVAVRLMVLFIPIIMDGGLVIFAESYKNMMAKIVLVLGICSTAAKASGMISGILADNAGTQSIMAGDVGSGLAEKGMSLGAGLAKKGAQLGFKAATGLASGIGAVTGLSAWGDKKMESLKNFGQSIRDKGFKGAKASGWTTNKQDKENEAKAEKQFETDKQDYFQEKLLGAFGIQGFGGQNGQNGEQGAPGTPGGQGENNGPNPQINNGEQSSNQNNQNSQVQGPGTAQQPPITNGTQGGSAPQNLGGKN